MRNKVIEPINNTKSGSEFLRELAKRLKIDEDYTYNNISEYRIAQAGKNVDLIAQLEKLGVVNFDVPEILL